MRTASLIVMMKIVGMLYAQDSLSVRPGHLNAQSILFADTQKQKQDSAIFKTPVYRQGFFCNFEDQLNRKKVPIDFSLGNSKY